MAAAVTLAKPRELVIEVLLDNAALAPAVGTVKVTTAPVTGFPEASFTLT